MHLVPVFQVGRCAVELSANMRRYDAESLELCLLKAKGGGHPMGSHRRLLVARGCDFFCCVCFFFFSGWSHGRIAKNGKSGKETTRKGAQHGLQIHFPNSFQLTELGLQGLFLIPAQDLFGMGSQGFPRPDLSTWFPMGLSASQFPGSSQGVQEFPAC